MNLFKILVLILSFSGTLHANNSPQWHLEGKNEGWKDEFLALKYFHNSELQRQWAWHLLGTYHFIGNEHILDFGCGDGKIAAEVSHFIPQGKITGVDLSSSMITFAQRCFPKAYFPNLSFKQTADVDYNDSFLGEKYDLIYSFCVFHIVANPIDVLNNLRMRLANDGRLLLVTPIGNNPAFFKAANEMFTQYKLKAPWGSANQNTSATMRTEAGCKHCLESAGLEILSIVALHTPTVFFNKQELEWMVGTVAANWQIPLEISDSFFNGLIDRMAELDTDVVDPSGAYQMKLSRLEIVAKLAK